MKKTVFVMFLVLTVLAGGLYAGGSKQAGGAASGGTVKTVTLSVGRDEGFAGAQAVIDAIEAKLGIRTMLEIRPGGTEGDNIVKTRLAAGDMADIFLYNTGSLLQSLNPVQNILDITDEPFMGKVTDSFKTAASVNGRVYAIPFATANTGAWLYNRRVYRELGLSVPHTWKDLLANLDKVQAAGKTALIGAYKDSWTSQLIVLADEYNVKAAVPTWPADYTANRRKIATTPAALRSFEKLAETRKYLNKDYLATTVDVALEMLASGQGVHFPIVGSLGAIAVNYPDKINDIGVFGQPGDDPNNHGITVWEANGFYIYKHSPNTGLAKQWMDFYISQEGIDIYSSKVKPEGPYSIRGLKLPADSYPAVLEMQTYLDTGKSAPALEFESPVKGPNLEQICVEIGSGITEPKAGAAAYDADVQKQATQLNLPGW